MKIIPHLLRICLVTLQLYKYTDKIKNGKVMEPKLFTACLESWKNKLGKNGSKHKLWFTDDKSKDEL